MYTLIFPHQLFEYHPALAKGRKVMLVEEFLFFRQYNFHKQKIAYHRASMKYYEHHLRQKQYEVEYIEASEPEGNVTQLIAQLAAKNVKEIHVVDVTDNWLHKRISSACSLQGIVCKWYDSPMFLNSEKELESYFDGTKRFFQTDFYIHQRKKHSILLDAVGKPFGGKWTFDAENRLKYPKGKIPPTVSWPASNKFSNEARTYANNHFAANYGSLNEHNFYPVTHRDAESWLYEFLENRFDGFGDYEDALVANESILHHSVLSPMLNVGLLTPQQVLNAALTRGMERGERLNSLEGFVRQIVGWREFIRAVYHYKGVEERNKNYWNFNRKIPLSFWKGDTTIAPLDAVILKLNRTAYAHHIERLMVMGNFMLLCEFDPDEVYRWFMEMHIDAYDWVMVPNVYGMSQFADGGLMSTKPYISGSNYLMKMSDYKMAFTAAQNQQWAPIWDALFWRFMHVHRDFFTRNPRLGMLVRTFDKMTEQKRTTLLKCADDYLKTLN